MSTTNQLGIIHRLEKIIAELQKAYTSNQAVSLELNKMSTSVDKLTAYLTNLDQLKPNYSTNEVNELVVAVDLHVAILKEELEPTDYKKLSNAMKAVKIILRFHPARYNTLTFMTAWLLEWIYFI